jgi:uncharacterized protein YceH (UPF0502 family)
MEVTLTDEEVRVLGSLVEKSTTTPEYYPMSLNALKNACNQRSSREPVVEYDESIVAAALEGLRDKHLVWYVNSAESRVQKYKHRFPEAFDLGIGDVAVLAVLMLRGPQTAGEIRGRTGRMHEFETVEEVERVLEALAARPETPLATKLPRQPGRKEHRYAHLLSGVPADLTHASAPSSAEPEAIARARSERERIAALEAEVSALREEVAELRGRFDSFSKQFE